MKLATLKSQRIITDPEDTVLQTHITGHPSIGKPDEVVWKYEKVCEEFRRRVQRGKIHIMKRV